MTFQDLLIQLVSINSVNPHLGKNPRAESEIAGFIADWCRVQGLETHLYEVAPQRANVVAVARGTGGGKTLLLNAHTDTVGVADMRDPFDLEARGGKLYGRGVLDMKSGLAAAMLVMVRAKAARLRGDVVLTAVCDEEYGSVGTASVLEEVAADAAIVTEPSDMNLCLAHRGFAVFEVEIAGKAAHTSQEHLGVNAITEAARLLVAIHEADALLRQTRHPLLGSGSLQPTLIAGGQELFTTPAQCKVSVERRTLPGETQARVESEMQEMLQRLAAAHPEFQATLKTVLYRDAYEVSSAEPIVKLAQKHLPDAKQIGLPYWMDSALIGAKGIPTLVIGPGGGGMHAREEWVNVNDLDTLVSVLEKITLEFCA